MIPYWRTVDDQALAVFLAAVVLTVALGRQRDCPTILLYWRTVDDQALAVALSAIVLTVALGRQRDCPAILPYWRTVDDRALAVALALAVIVLTVALGRQRDCPIILPYYRTVDDQKLQRRWFAINAGFILVKWCFVQNITILLLCNSVVSVYRSQISPPSVYVQYFHLYFRYTFR